MANNTKLARARLRVQEERVWIDEHGRNLAGYIRRYGSKNDPEHYGDGGEAIYAADLAALHGAVANLEELDPKHTIAGLIRIKEDLES